jgi:hypothetical protein
MIIKIMSYPISMAMTQSLCKKQSSDENSIDETTMQTYLSAQCMYMHTRVVYLLQFDSSVLSELLNIMLDCY